jgi:hypothetical protein
MVEPIRIEPSNVGITIQPCTYAVFTNSKAHVQQFRICRRGFSDCSQVSAFGRKNVHLVAASQIYWRQQYQLVAVLDTGVELLSQLRCAPRL